MSEKKTVWQRIKKNARYCISGVWNDTRSLWSVKAVKVINLSVRSFLDRDLQVRAAALTYYTVLAIVPALAMLFAIGRGFGFQNLLQSELFRYFPAQHQVLDNALAYVDNYLAQASQGAFIGIGIALLIWTLTSLMSNVEDTFNHVWGITAKRSMQRKLIDYTALFMLLPVLMVCSAGISIFMSDTVQHYVTGDVLSPMMHRLLALMPTLISWIVFTAAYLLVPNTKVRFKGALFAGVLCGTMFQVVQWLFVSGQVYVSKYNTIYGSFAFLPLLLVWLQLSWLIALSGVVLTYAWQNFDNFAYGNKAEDISQDYANNLAIAVLTIAVKRFKLRQQPLTLRELATQYDIPGKIATRLLDRLQRAGLLTAINQDKDEGDVAYHPSYDPDDFTVNSTLDALTSQGNADFIPKADARFAQLAEQLADLRQRQRTSTSDIRLLDLP